MPNTENVIHVTDLGLQAANNASAGGVLINVSYFKIGDSDAECVDTDEDIRGNNIYQNTIALIEVLTENSVRFTFDVPDTVVTGDTMAVSEVGLFLDDNIMFGRCVFTSPYLLRRDTTTRIHAVLVTTRVDPSVINITVGDLSSIPSAAAVHRLPPPDSSAFNVLSVLDALDNVDGTISPGIALKFGAGALQWAFSGYDRVFSGHPDAGASPTEFQQSAVTTALSFRNGEIVIGYCVSGPSRGQSRKYYYSSASNSFIEKDNVPMLNFDESSTIVIWRRIAGAQLGASDYPPSLAGIPPDWVITRGVGQLPVWAPPKNTGKHLNTLFKTPGKMRISSLNYVGSGRDNRYHLGGTLLEDVNHCINAIGGITQHNSAYDISSGEIEYASSIPSHASIDLRLVTKEEGTGTYVSIHTDSFVCDGSQFRFKLSNAIESSDYAFCYLRGLLQSVTAYTYDTVTQEIVFVSAPSEGIELEVSSFVMKQDEGYSTHLSSNTIITVGDTLFLELPLDPQSIDYTFVSVSGTHIHRDKYTLIDNKIVFSSPVGKNLEVECLVFDNVLTEGTPQTDLAGMVVDAVLTSKSLKLLRHNSYPVVLPIPAINLTSGSGIRITGNHPEYKVSNTFAQQFTESTNFKFSTLRKLKDSEEIIFTYRVTLDSDVVVQVSADFSSVLGPGFVSVGGLEIMQYVIGFRTTGAKEPDYGRDIKGTGETGFSSLSGNTNERAFANASITQVFDMIKDNIPTGYVDIVARMRVRNGNISKYGSKLSINFNVMGTPKL